MQTSYTKIADNHRLKIDYDVTPGESRNIPQKKCEICGEWFDIDDIQEREEHIHCSSDKCTEAVSMMILLENQENE